MKHHSAVCQLVASLLIWFANASALAGEAVPAADRTVHCKHGAVVSVSRPASEVGLAILRRGGNAVDAAVATAFALAVAYPAAGNIGGGGFLLAVFPDGEAKVIDFRETAPAAATVDMFVDPARRTSHRRVGTPGTVAGLFEARERLGKGNLTWHDVIQPAIELARGGFELDEANAKSLNGILSLSDKQRFAALHQVFGKPGGGAWQSGDRLVQPQLASTLERIRDQGSDGFYRGETADLLVAEMQRGGGLITHDDLAQYRSKTRSPVHGIYRGHVVLGVPPPSSGGTTLIEALNTVLCVTMNVIDFKMDIASAVVAPRFHHQWLPDQIRVERQLTVLRPGVIAELRALGHTVVETKVQGDAHSIWIDPDTGEIVAAPDSRVSGYAAGY